MTKAADPEPRQPEPGAIGTGRGKPGAPEPVPLPGTLFPSHIAAFRFIEAAANGGRYVTAAELDHVIGTQNVSGSTQANVCRTLERWGLIATTKFQRGRQFTILATGAKTAPPRNTTPHWRTLPPPKKKLLSISPAALKRSEPDLAHQMLAAAREEGMSLPTFLLELVWVGWRHRNKGR